MSATIFTIKRSEIEGRLDPEQYHTERLEAIKKIKSTRNFKSLFSVANFDKHITTEILPEDIYVGLENIESNYGNYIKTTEKNSISSANIFKKGDVLFPKLRPYLNKVFLADFDGICSTEFYVLQSKLVSPEYLSIFLRSTLVVNQTKHLMTGNTLPRLQTEDVEKLLIPIPTETIQKEIINIFNNAKNKRQQKQQQAKQLLDSIDSYLLDELGIKLPQKDNSLSKRIFTTRFSEVSGGRLDAKFFCIESKSIQNAIENSKYETKALKSFIIQNVSGEWGIDENEIISNATKCLVIRSTEFDNDYNLKLDNTRAKYRLIPNSKLKSIDLQENDLLIEKSGGSEDQPVGRIAILTKDILESATLCFSNFIHKIRVHNIDAEYLFCFLKTAHNIKLTERMFAQTNGLQNLIMQTYFNQKIPLPPLPKQKEIATHIKEIREQAKQLQMEADQSLQEAKKQIEKMILGE